MGDWGIGHAIAHQAAAYILAALIVVGVIAFIRSKP
jgi:hypothetical protein